VATEVLQFIIMTIACILVGIIAMAQVPAGTLTEIVPQGWMTPTFAWHLDIDWSSQLAAANTKIADDGYSMFSIFIMLALFKGILQSMAGPAPNFDMQRVLSAKTPTEAAKMSAIVNVVMLFPRYMLITGLVVLAIAFSMDELRAMGADVDFEQILPMVTREFIPSGLLGLLLAGLLAAFMSTFAATTNAAPAYLVNDVYKRYINPNASQGLYLKLSYVVSVIFVILGTTIGLFIPSLNQLIMWIVSALYGGYVAANVLKWYWWRFNGFGYFFGMLAGILAAIPMAWIEMSPLNAFPYLFLFCLFICVSVSLITKADDMEVLKRFYFKTRPWGFWRPVREALQNDGLDVKKNSDFARDASNVVVGLLWQTSLAALPIFLVIKQWPSFITAAVLVAITTLILKFNWYDNISDEPD
jgi:Na+/proline symporter